MGVNSSELLHPVANPASVIDQPKLSIILCLASPAVQYCKVELEKVTPCCNVNADHAVISAS